MLVPITPPSSAEGTHSPLARDMEIDSGNPAPVSEPEPSYPEGYIPLELPFVTSSTQGNEVEREEASPWNRECI